MGAACIDPKRWGFKRRMGYLFFRNVVPLIMRSLFDFKIEGKENIPKEGCGIILAPNHQSFFDPFFVGSAIPFRLCHFFASSKFLAKKQFVWVRWAGAFPVEQGGGKGQRAVDYSAKLVQDGCSTVIFPEGERSRTGRFLRARAGLGRIAHQSKGTIIPVYVEGARDALPRGKIGPAFGARVLVKFGSPLDFSDLYSKPLTREVALEISHNTLEAIKKLQHELHSKKK